MRRDFYPNTLVAMKFNLKNISANILLALRQGTSPRMLALTCALGVVIGIFPVFGTTTLLCLAISIAFRLNVPIMQVINYIVAPIQLLLIIPFIKAGTYVFHVNPFPYTVDELMGLFKTDLLLLLKEAGIGLLLGIAAWLIIAGPLFLVIFFPLFWVFSQWKEARYREL